MNKIKVYSEIGKLNSVLLHRPGKEVENLTPELLERLLFDDIPFLKIARQEHDNFASVLKANGVKVYYIEELMAETIEQNPEIRSEFINKFVEEANIDKKWKQQYLEFITKMPNLEMVNEMIGGTMKIDLDTSNKEDYPFITDPLPNTLFQRDPFASSGKGIILNHMWSVTRNRETIFPEYVFKYHKDFKDTPLWYERDSKDNIEGGDVMVLNADTLVIGASQRTSLNAIEKLSKKILKEDTFKQIIVLELPKSRAYMHLDTVFTNIDYDKFIAHPLIFDDENLFKIYKITENKKELLNQSLSELLKELIGKEPIIIKCGGEDKIAAGREQWNDGTNVLTIKPGVVIAYERNHKTISMLKDAGVKVLEVPSSELSRGRGGPRCMSMPIERENI
ncbi:arginine deiminase [Spiroplasma endosymbiont of Crioceris asparagi]|uniref:arginine deiminase n=1 Tax=Spiroplasma endosymbiont of Crioceris asparagi TaxID=3066286 RepID=UPI0030CAA2AB